MGTRGGSPGNISGVVAGLVTSVGFKEKNIIRVPHA